MTVFLSGKLSIVSEVMRETLLKQLVRMSWIDPQFWNLHPALEAMILMQSHCRPNLSVSQVQIFLGLQIRALKFQSSSSKFPRARTCELHRARSRLYRSQFLQVNTRWKALVEIYTMHSFAPFWNRIPKNEVSNLNFLLKLPDLLLQNFANFLETLPNSW